MPNVKPNEESKSRQCFYLSVKPFVSCTTVQIKLISILAVDMIITLRGVINDFIYRTIAKISDVLFPFISYP